MKTTIKTAFARLTDDIRGTEDGVSAAEMEALIDAIGQARGWTAGTAAPAEDEPGAETDDGDDQLDPERVHAAVLKLFAELNEPHAA